MYSGSTTHLPAARLQDLIGLNFFRLHWFHLASSRSPMSQMMGSAKVSLGSWAEETSPASSAGSGPAVPPPCPEDARWISMDESQWSDRAMYLTSGAMTERQRTARRRALSCLRANASRPLLFHLLLSPLSASILHFTLCLFCLCQSLSEHLASEPSRKPPPLGAARRVWLHRGHCPCAESPRGCGGGVCALCPPCLQRSSWFVDRFPAKTTHEIA